MKWLAGMHNTCPVKLQSLYTRARICQEFPAYKLHELRDAPAGELLQAIELLNLAKETAK